MTLDATDTRYWHHEIYQQLAEDSDAKRVIDNCFGQMTQYLRHREDIYLMMSDDADIRVGIMSSAASANELC